jgi:hypothetical protein
VGVVKHRGIKKARFARSRPTDTSQVSIQTSPRLDNPETIAKHKQALIANINAGARAEVIAASEAAL